MAEEKEISLKKMKKELTGIFGFGLSDNIYLDILNIVILAFTGIIIKIFFQENFSKDGTVGPASTTIWGYGLTCIALIILIFISFYLIKRPRILEEGKKISVFEYLKMTIRDVLPIFLTLFIIFYIILLIFIFFNRINSNRVTDSYHSYSFISTILIIIQLILMVKYIYVDLESTNSHKLSEENLTTVLSKNATYILSTINFVFIVILHILLAFFSTDG